MATCIVCGASTDGHICNTHEEDVSFEFRGSSPNQLTAGRFYRGSVDGFADFGVFIDIGDAVTGLLHRSEVPGRIESLDWESGDQVYVQVTNVQNNGNVDLSWSIREEKRDFRGNLVDDPSAKTNAELVEKSEGNEQSAENEHSAEVETETETADGGTPAPQTSGEFEFGDSNSPVATTNQAGGVDSSTANEHENDSPDISSSSAQKTPSAVERVEISGLDAQVGDRIALEAEITNVRQTSGPTVFELTDDTGMVDCAAFKEAGERAHPEAETGDIVRLVGEVESHHGERQIETEELTVLSGAAADAVTTRMDNALTERAAPTDTDLLAEDDQISAVHEDLIDAATTVRRAVIDGRPVVLRHTATVEGYVAGAALEHALLPLVRDQHERDDAEYHFVSRRPLNDAFYTIDDATKDVTKMLEAAERHDEKHPLFVLIGTGATSESADGIDLLKLYDASTIVVDGGYTYETPDIETLVSPTVNETDPVNTGALGVQLAALINNETRTEIHHLPGIAYWTDIPDSYMDIAKENGYDRDKLETLRDAIALEAFYQTYDGKRELITDLLWDETDEALPAHIADQFRTRLTAKLDTAEPHLEPRGENGIIFGMLAVNEFTQRYDFPPTGLLLDALFRQDERPDVLIGMSGDELRIRSNEEIDVRAVGEYVAEELPEAGVIPRGGRDGRIEFLSGERDAITDAVITAITDQIA